VRTVSGGADLPGLSTTATLRSRWPRVRDHLGRAAEVRVIDIPDQPAAEQARFLGSPTIGADGRDIEPGAERHQKYVHTCRLYHVGHSLRGLPDEDWLRQVLRTAEPRP
jgi:hypothetical protein